MEELVNKIFIITERISSEYAGLKGKVVGQNGGKLTIAPLKDDGSYIINNGVWECLLINKADLITILSKNQLE